MARAKAKAKVKSAKSAKAKAKVKSVKAKAKAKIAKARIKAKDDRTREPEMAKMVEAILEDRSDETGQYHELREIIDKSGKLTKADRAKSLSRPAEQKWQQILRNIISHEREGFVQVEGGIRLQWRGKAKPRPTKTASRSRHGEPEMRAAA